MHSRSDKELASIVKVYLTEDIFLAHKYIETLEEYAELSKKQKKFVNEKYIRKLCIDTYIRLLDDYTKISAMIDDSVDNIEYKKAIERNNIEIKNEINKLTRQINSIGD